MVNPQRPFHQAITSPLEGHQDGDVTKQNSLNTRGVHHIYIKGFAVLTEL